MSVLSFDFAETGVSSRFFFSSRFFRFFSTPRTFLFLHFTVLIRASNVVKM